MPPKFTITPKGKFPEGGSAYRFDNLGSPMSPSELLQLAGQILSLKENTDNNLLPKQPLLNEGIQFESDYFARLAAQEERAGMLQVARKPTRKEPEYYIDTARPDDLSLKRNLLKEPIINKVIDFSEGSRTFPGKVKVNEFEESLNLKGLLAKVEEEERRNNEFALGFAASQLLDQASHVLTRCGLRVSHESVTALLTKAAELHKHFQEKVKE